MEEVTKPDGHREEEVKPHVVDMTQRDDPLPEVAHHIFDLIIYGHFPHQQKDEQQRRQSADKRDDVAGGGKLPEECVEACART